MNRFSTFRQLLLSLAAGALLTITALSSPPVFAAIAFVAQAENSSAAGVTALACSSTLTLAAGDIVEFQVYGQVPSSTDLTITDGLGDAYVLEATSTAVLSGSTFLYTYVAQNSAAGTATPQAVTSTGTISGVYAKQIRGGATSGAVLGSASNVVIGGPGTGANIVVSGTVSIPSAQNVLISGFTINPQSQTPLATAGTSPLAFTGRTAVWSVLGGGTAFTVPEDIRVVGASGNVQATYGVSGGGAQFDNFGTNVTVYAEAGGGGGRTGAASNYLVNHTIDYLLRPQAFTAPTTAWAALATTIGSPNACGTEVTGGSYARVSVTSSLSHWAGTQSAGSTTASTGTSGTTSNNAAITFPAPTANWGTVTEFCVFDASTSGNLLFRAALSTSKTVNNGDAAPSFAISALTWTIN